MTEQEIAEIENQAWSEVPDDGAGLYRQMIQRFATIIENRTLERAAVECESERVYDTEEAEDLAYNTAIKHCSAAIRQLKNNK